MSLKLLAYYLPKVVQWLFMLLVLVLMILWIVLCVEATRQISEMHTKQPNRNRVDNQRQNIQSATFTMPILRRSTVSRLYQVAIFNTILEEIIAVIAIICLVLRKIKLFFLALFLLTIIWFIEQYRISDFSHQIDFIDLQNSQIILVAHIIHFLIIIIGILIVVADQNNSMQLTQVDEDDLVTTKQTKKVFVNFNESIEKPKQPCCESIRIMFTKMWPLINGGNKSTNNDVEMIGKMDYDNRSDNSGSIVPIQPINTIVSSEDK